MNSISIFDVRLHDLTMDDAQLIACSWFNSNRAHFVVTPNPEIILHARRNSAFREILNNADLSLPDGIGLMFASWFLGQPLHHRVTGTDFLERLLIKLSHDRPGTRVFFLGGKGESHRALARNISQMAPNLVVESLHGGTIAKQGGEWHMDTEIVRRVQEFSPELLAVGLPFGVQERWIKDHLSVFPSIKLAIGVGGALEFLSGTIRRAPKCMRIIGLEWLWRLIQEPRRITRIVNAVIVFPLTVLLYGSRKQS